MNWKKKDAVLILTVLLIAGAAFGKAKMTDADCPDQLCVHQKAASKNHESIICLPNKVVVEVDGSEESEFDAVAN